jgi:hypothetical protein
MASGDAVRPAVQRQRQNNRGDGQAAYGPTSTASSLEWPLDDNRRVRRSGVGRAAVLALALCFALIGAAPAVADDSSPEPPSDASAVDVYRESVPTSGGPRVVDPNRGRTVPLPSAIEERLRRDGGSEARALDRIATSADLGAPARGPRSAPVSESPATMPEGWAPHGLWRAGRDVLELRRAQTRILVLFALLIACVVGAFALRLRAGTALPND